MRRTPLDGWIEERLHISLQDRKELEDYQLGAINRVLREAAAQSPFYRKHLRGIESLHNLDEIHKLPFTDSGLLREKGMQMLCVPTGEIARVVTLLTTGTTGLPKRVFFTREDQELTVDFFRWGMSTLAYPGEKVFIALPCASEGSVGDLLARGLQRDGIKSVPYGFIENMEEASQCLAQSGAQVLVGAPGQVLKLARYCATRGIRSEIRRVLVSTEYAAAEVIREIEELWNCRVFNHYGMTEMGLGGAVECEAHQGMHIRENDLYMEVVHPDTGEVLPMGQEGELVFTTLTRRGMPLIRYRTGDTAALLEDTCACGSVLRRIDSIRFDRGRERLAGNLLT